MDARHPLAIRDYRLFFTARIGSTLAQNATVVMIGWQVYDVARRSMGTKAAAFQLGLVGLAQFLPLFALTLITGWVADRVDRRLIARICFALQACCAGALALLNVAAAVSLPALFTIAAALGVARAFSMPAMGAFAPNLVPAALLPRAIASNSVAARVGAIVGPAASGYLYALSPSAPYSASAALIFISFLCVTMIKPLPRRMPDGSRNPWAQMTDGLKYVIHNKLVLGSTSLDLFAVLLGGATAMLPVYARDILHAGADGLGNLRAAPAVGSILVALWFMKFPLKRQVGVKMLFAVAMFGVATVIFGLSRNMILSLAALTTLGAADMFSVFVRQSLIQLYTPDEMRGRVSAISSLFISASSELGEAESGFVAALIGPVAAVVSGGVGAVLITMLWAHLFPSIRQAHSFDHAAETIRPPAP